MPKAPFPSWIVGAAIAVIGVAGVAGGLTMAGRDAGAVVSASGHPTTTGAATATHSANAASAPAAGAAAIAVPSPSGAPATVAAAAHQATATTATRAPKSTVASPATTRPPAVVVGVSPAAPGTYRYHQAGTLPGTPAVGTLVVAPASASGTQTWTRMVGGSVAPASTVMLFNAHGAFMVAPAGSVSGAQAACSFASPLPWPPYPTTVGGRASGHATCTGGISTYDVAEQVQGTATLPLAGASVTTTVVVSTVVITGTVNGGPLRVSLTETDWYAPTLRVPVQTKTHVAGSVMGLSVTTDRTDTLISSTPS
jgi:hypothetical protein